MSMHIGVIRPRGVNIGNWRLIEAKIKSFQVRDWIVEEKDIIFPNCIHDTCEWWLIIV